MTPRGKVGLAATVVIAALAGAALMITSAGAHTPANFAFPNGGNTIIESKVDGVHEIVIPSWGTLVCQRVDFLGTVTGTSATKLALDPFFSECKLGGENAAVSSEACQFVFGADGSMTISPRPGESCSKFPIKISTENNCQVFLPEQNLTGIGYTNISNSEQITFSMTITKLSGTRKNCAPEGSFTSGQYKTGNTILYGTEDPGATKKPIKWVATVP